MSRKQSVLALILVLLMAGWSNSLGQGDADKWAMEHNKLLESDSENSIGLERALKFIEDDYNVSLLYSNDLVEKRFVEQEDLNGSLKEALQQVLSPFELTYNKIAENSYTIVKNFSIRSVAPQDSLQGKVIDAESEKGLPGVNIIVQGTTKGTSTNMDGEYKLALPAGADTLVYTYLGYESQKIAVDGRSRIDVTMVPTSISGEELVVVGYGTQQKRDLTGSVTSINSEEFSSEPVSSISDAMHGKAAGVQVVSSGEPGTDASFRIRGTSTIGNSDPLIVIDGFPTDAGLNQLNPNDIESIEVLKDASAAAIYGSRGANGVVIVTTKSGSANESQITVDISRSYQEVTNMVDMLDASEFARLHNEMMENNGLPKNPAFSNPEELGEGTDWLDHLFRVSPKQNYSISYSGGNEKSSFYVSGNILDEQGVITETGYEKYTIQLNTDTRLYDWLKFGNKLTLNHDVNTSGSYNIQNTMGALPTQPLRDEDGTYSGPEGRSSWVGDIQNPIGQAKLIENSTKGYNAIGNVYTEIDFTPHLQLRSKLGLKANFWNSRTWSPEYDWQPNPQEQAYLYEQYNKNINWLFDNTLTYDRVFDAVHHVKMMLGSSAQENNYDFMNGSVKGFASERTRQLTNGSEQPTLDGNGSEWSLLSYMGRLNYSYDDTYLITATLRRDGSSRFGEGNKWGWFPSGSFAWRVSNEDFFNVNYINDLKLRVGYGLTGNQEIGNYPFASSLQTIQYNFGGGLVPAVVPNVMPNPNVRWETVEQFNAGFDVSMLNDRVSLTLDAYLKNTRDMLVPMSVPVTTGYSDIDVPDVNAGEIQNKGFEISLSTDNITGEFNWSSNFNMSYNDNQVESLNDTIPMPAGNIDFNYNVARFEAGHPVNAFYGYVTNGVFQTQEEVDNYAVQVPGSDPNNRTSPGDLKFVDLNNDGVINDKDRTYIGDPNQDFTFSLNNSFNYKGFDLRIFLQAVVGNDIFNANRIWSEGMAAARNQTEETLNRWTGQGTSDKMPRAVYSDPNNNTRASTRFVEDGSYLRLKNVTLGYSLPADIIQKLNLSRVRLYATGQNLLTLTKYSGFDPEVSFNGIDNNVYPVTRTLSFGINLSF